MPRSFSTGIEVPVAGDQHPSEAWWSRVGSTTNAALLRMDAAQSAAWKAAVDALRVDSLPRSEAEQFGIPGPPNVLSVGTVQGGVTAAASITGKAPAQSLNLTLPQGPKGPPGPGGAFPLVETEHVGVYRVSEEPYAPYAYATVESSKADALAAEASAVEKANAYTDTTFAASGPGGATDDQVDAAVNRAVLGGRVLGRADLTVLATDHGVSVASADNVAALQAAVNAAADSTGHLLIPAGTYVFDNSQSVEVPSGVQIEGQGATLVQVRNAPVFTVPAGAQNVSFTGVTVQGTMPDTLTATIQNQVGIRAHGEPASPIRNLRVSGCRFLGMEGSGIHVKNVWDFRFQNNDFVYYGSSAIGCYSVRRGLIEGNVLRGTGKLPEYSGNAYGIFVSTLEADGPVGSAEAPRSTDVMVRGNTLHDQVWSALDTHVGKRISFVSNHLHNCAASGINAVYISMSGANYGLAPQDILIEGNVLTYEDRNESNSLLQQAILLRGSMDLGNQARERATGVIRGNIIRGYGRMNDSGSGAIFVGSASGVVIEGNALIECRSTGIQVRDSIGTTIASNTITDLWRSSGLAPAVYLRVGEDINMDVTVTSTKLIRGGLIVGTHVPAGASVNNAGIHGSTDPRISTIEADNEWGSASHAAGMLRMQKGVKSRTVLEGAAAPAGAKPDGNPWVVGDRVENSSPAGGAYLGWVCVNGGAPGTWQPYGRIGA